MSDAIQTPPLCPGCHFRCELNEYQCARGGKFFEKWKAGEEIPQRRGPQPPAQDGEDKSKPAGRPAFFNRIPVEARLKMLMGLFQNVVRERDEQGAKQRVAECILRQDGFAANGIITERTRLTDEQIQKEVETLQAEGVVQPRTEPDGRVFHELTEEGKAQTEAWIEERQKADAELFANLSDEEKGQLESLLGKAFEPFMRRGPKPRK